MQQVEGLWAPFISYPLDHILVDLMHHFSICRSPALFSCRIFLSHILIARSCPVFDWLHQSPTKVDKHSSSSEPCFLKLGYHLEQVHYLIHFLLPGLARPAGIPLWEISRPFRQQLLDIGHIEPVLPPSFVGINCRGINVIFTLPVPQLETNSTYKPRALVFGWPLAQNRCFHSPK